MSSKLYILWVVRYGSDTGYRILNTVTLYLRPTGKDSIGEPHLNLPSQRLWLYIDAHTRIDDTWRVKTELPYSKTMFLKKILFILWTQKLSWEVSQKILDGQPPYAGGKHLTPNVLDCVILGLTPENSHLSYQPPMSQKWQHVLINKC